MNNWNEYGKIPKYSQRNEQGMILQYFKNKQGNFLDIGSHNGITFSNTHALALLGWKGTCVEASPSVIPDLKKNYKDRKDIQIIPKGVYYETGSYVFHDANGDFIGSLFIEELEQWTRGFNVKFEEKQIQCLSPKDLVKSLKYDFYNLVNIDIEGDTLGVDIFKAIYALGIKPEMIVIEVGGSERIKFNNYARSLGYQLYHETVENLLLCL